MLVAIEPPVDPGRPGTAADGACYSAPATLAAADADAGAAAAAAAALWEDGNGYAVGRRR